MTGLKTIVATGVLVFTATAVAFGGVHLGQPSAGASPATTAGPEPVKATYTVHLTAGQLEHLAKLLGGRQARTGTRHPAQYEATHHRSRRTAARQTAPVQSQASWTTSGTTQHTTAHTICPTARCVSRTSSHDGGCSEGGRGGGCGDGGGD